MSQDDVDALVAQARRGDRAAFRRIVIEVENDLRFFLGAFEASEGLTDEIVQSTLVTAYQKLDSYRGEGTFRAWLKAIARNQLMRTLREQKRYAELTGDRLDGLLAESRLDEIERIEELEGRTRRLRACLEKLPAALRALVEARYTQGLPTARLAEEFRRTQIWVRVSLCRVRQSLRRCIEQPGGTAARAGGTS